MKIVNTDAQQISSSGTIEVAPPPHKKRMLLKSFGEIQKSGNESTLSQEKSMNVSSNLSSTVKTPRTYSRRKAGHPKSQ